MRDAIRTDYADGWRAGWAEGLGAAAVELRRQARHMRDRARGCTYVASNAATLETAADTLAEMPDAYEPTGLEYRGG